MRRTWVIIKREIGAYFATPVAFVFITIFVGLAGALTFYVGGFFERNQASLDIFFSYHPWLYLLLVPAVAMRSWAEERKSGTIEQLLTLPVTTAEAVLGKFFAAWLFCGIALALTFPMWVSVNYLGHPDNGAIIAGFGGSFLMAGALLAISMCMSALTRNQVIAFITAALICFAFMVSGVDTVLGFLRDHLPSTAIETFTSFSFLARFASLRHGVVEIRDIVFFVSSIAFWLFACVVAIDTMMKIYESRGFALCVVGMVAVIFVALNVVANSWLGNWRIDLTQDRGYSTSDAIKPILASVNEPINVRLYFSPKMGDINARYAIFYQRARDLLSQYAKLSGGKVRAELYDPEPYSDVEDRAAAFGLKAVPLTRNGEVGYFGLAASNSTDDQEVIPFFDLDREQLLEYDLAKVIYKLSEVNPPHLGLITSLPVDGGPATSGDAPPAPWLTMAQVSELFDVTGIDPSAQEIPQDIDTLLLIEPAGLSDRLQYAIDQFVMRGGKVVAFVDTVSESSETSDGPAPLRDLSGIRKLLKAWGVSLSNDVIGDRKHAVRIDAGGEARPEVTHYVAWLEMHAEDMNSHDPVTAGLKTLNIATAGALDPIAAANTTFTPLISTSPDSMRIRRERFLGPVPDIAGLFRDFVPSGKREVLAARVTGIGRSAFDKAPDGAQAPFLAQSVRPIRIIVVSDADMLADRFWTTRKDFMGRQMVEPVADNGNLLLNALEDASGAPALWSLRARETSSRPLARVDALRQRAEAQYAAAEQELTDRLEILQQHIAAIGTTFGAGTTLSDADKSEIQDYRNQVLTTRRQLRMVQRAFREEVDHLEDKIKFANIATAPMLFGLFLFAAVGVRRFGRGRSAQGVRR